MGSSSVGQSGMGSSTSSSSGMGSSSKGSSTSGGASGLDRTNQMLSGAASQAGDKVASTIDSQKNRAADGLGSFAQALRQTGDQMRGQTQGAPVDQYVASAASQIERFSGYLRSTNTKEIVRNVEDFARQQPALFIGGAFMLGLLGARFLKSSERPETSGKGPRVERAGEDPYGVGPLGAPVGAGSSGGLDDEEPLRGPGDDVGAAVREH